MAREKLRVVGKKHALCSNSMRLVRFLHATIMLTVACSISKVLDTVGIGEVSHWASAMTKRERSTVQRPDGVCVYSRFNFPYRVTCELVFEKG